MRLWFKLFLKFNVKVSANSRLVLELFLWTWLACFVEANRPTQPSQAVGILDSTPKEI